MSQARTPYSAASDVGIADTVGSADNVGIAALGIHLPPMAVNVEELARLRGVAPEKYTLGLGCRHMALCPEGFGAVDLATEAARRALARWSGKPNDIGLVAVGTESALDMSRPLSAWVADELDIRGAVRSYEVKHACYGGTLALRQAVEWKRSGAARGKAALVIATDVALYEPASPGEPTQGAGAVAMVIDQPEIAAIGIDSYAWSEPAFDFWRPVGESFPHVDGPFSLDCYKRAAENCLSQWLDDQPATDALADALDQLRALCFHVPFPKMVQKAMLHVGEQLGWPEAQNRSYYEAKVEPTMGWNRQVGNAYTASLWLSVAEALAGCPQGETIGAFSYGSGFGAEFQILTAGPAAAAGDWRTDFEADIASRSLISASAYQRLRGEAAIAVA